MFTRGGVVSNVTCTLAVVTEPVAFVTTACRVLAPSSNGTCAPKVRLDAFTTAGTPLMTTAACGSPTVPRTWMGETFK